METFTPKERLKRYEEALKIYKASIKNGKNTGLCKGLCMALSLGKGIFDPYYPYNFSEMRRFYPEIADLAPEKNHYEVTIRDDFGGYWWSEENTEVRIETLEKAIEAVKKIIELEK